MASDVQSKLAGNPERYRANKQTAAVNTSLLPGFRKREWVLSPEYIHSCSFLTSQCGLCVTLSSSWSGSRMAESARPGKPSQVCLTMTLQDQLLTKKEKTKNQNTFKNHATKLLKQNEVGRGEVLGRGVGTGNPIANQYWSRWSCPSLAHNGPGSILSCQGDLTCQD